MKTLVLDNYDSFTFNLVHLLEQYSDDIDVYRNDQIAVEEIEQYDKILLSPGPSLPIDAGIMMEVIDRYHASKDILGICLGMQGIVQYFGGELFNLPEVKHGVSIPIEILKKEELLFKGVGEEMEVGLYHSWGTRKELLPNDLIETAKMGDVTMGVAHRKYKIRGVQFHPESIMTTKGFQLIHNWMSS